MNMQRDFICPWSRPQKRDDAYSKPISKIGAPYKALQTIQTYMKCLLAGHKGYSSGFN